MKRFFFILFIICCMFLKLQLWTDLSKRITIQQSSFKQITCRIFQNCCDIYIVNKSMWKDPNSIHFSLENKFERVVSNMSANLFPMATRKWVNIGWGNDLLLDGTEPLPWKCDLSLKMSCGIHIVTISKEMSMTLIFNMCSKFTVLNLLSRFPTPKELLH